MTKYAWNDPDVGLTTWLDENIDGSGGGDSGGGGPADTIMPTLSAPSLFFRTPTVGVEWDGLDVDGAPMPGGFARASVQRQNDLVYTTVVARTEWDDLPSTSPYLPPGWTPMADTTFRINAAGASPPGHLQWLGGAGAPGAQGATTPGGAMIVDCASPDMEVTLLKPLGGSLNLFIGFSGEFTYDEGGGGMTQTVVQVFDTYVYASNYQNQNNLYGDGTVSVFDYEGTTIRLQSGLLTVHDHNGVQLGVAAAAPMNTGTKVAITWNQKFTGMVPLEVSAGAPSDDPWDEVGALGGGGVLLTPNDGTFSLVAINDAGNPGPRSAVGPIVFPVVPSPPSHLTELLDVNTGYHSTPDTGMVLTFDANAGSPAGLWYAAAVPDGGGGGGGGGVDTTALHYKGAWDGTDAYVVDDVVTHATAAWVATADNTDVEPVATVVVGDMGTVAAPAPGNVGEPGDLGPQNKQKFQVSQAITVTAIRLFVATAYANPSVIGISTDFTGTEVVPWIGQATVTNGATGYQVFQLDNPVTLDTGVDYNLVQPAGGGSVAHAHATITGFIVPSEDTIRYGANYASSIAGYDIPVQLVGELAGAAPWDLLVQGIDPTAPTAMLYKGIYVPQAYAINDVVTHHLATYVCTNTYADPGGTDDPPVDLVGTGCWDLIGILVATPSGPGVGPATWVGNSKVDVGGTDDHIALPTNGTHLPILGDLAVLAVAHYNDTYDTIDGWAHVGTQTRASDANAHIDVFTRTLTSDDIYDQFVVIAGTPNLSSSVLTVVHNGVAPTAFAESNDSNQDMGGYTPVTNSLVLALVGVATGGSPSTATLSDPFTNAMAAASTNAWCLMSGSTVGVAGTALPAVHFGPTPPAASGGMSIGILLEIASTG